MSKHKHASLFRYQNKWQHHLQIAPPPTEKLNNKNTSSSSNTETNATERTKDPRFACYALSVRFSRKPTNLIYKGQGHRPEVRPRRTTTHQHPQISLLPLFTRNGRSIQRANSKRPNTQQNKRKNNHNNKHNDPERTYLPTQKSNTTYDSAPHKPHNANKRMMPVRANSTIRNSLESFLF